MSTWSTGLFPLATLVPLFGFLMAGHIVATRLLGAKFPEHVLEFTWEQLHIALAVMSALLMLCYLIVDHGSASFGVGFFFILFAAIGLTVGAFLLRNERISRRGAVGGTGAGPAPGPSGPAAYSPPASPPPPPPSTGAPSSTPETPT